MMMKHVMVIDDSIDLSQLYADILQRKGCRVSIAHDGWAALRLLDTHLPDLILLDLVMPNFNGKRLLRYLRADSRLRAIPVVVISGDYFARYTDVVDLADQFVTKPISVRELLKVVERYLNPETNAIIPYDPVSLLVPRFL